MTTVKKENYQPEIVSIEKSSINVLLKDYSSNQIFILVDENTKQFVNYLSENIPSLSDATCIEIDSGEKYKTIKTCTSIWQLLTSKNVRRNSLIINLGGGVITDMGGFVASTFKRGIDFINVPTTLLAMVDASIGGKTGVDMDNFKNQIGVFCHPRAVICDSYFLQSLPKRELISGFAEVLKHSLIKNSSYWKYCTTTEFENLNWNAVISDSVQIKSNIVAHDPLEKGERKLLNFGHTVGHAIETYLMNIKKSILHGEAVAAGIICESYISTKISTLSEEELQNITKEILKLFPKVDIQNSIFPELIDLMRNDKKNNSDQINFTLLSEIGNGVFNQTCEIELIEGSLAYYTSL